MFLPSILHIASTVILIKQIWLFLGSQPFHCILSYPSKIQSTTMAYWMIHDLASACISQLISLICCASTTLGHLLPLQHAKQVPVLGPLQLPFLFSWKFPFWNLHSCLSHLMIRFLFMRSSIKRPSLSIPPKRASSHSYSFILISFPTKLATLLGIIYYLVIYYVYWLLSTFPTIIRGRLFLFTAEFPTSGTLSAP